MPETAWIAALSVGVQSAYYIGSERGRYSHLSNVALPPEPFFRRIGEAVDHIVHDVFDERCARVYGDGRNKERLIEQVPSQPSPEMKLRRHSSDPKARWVDATPLNSKFVWGLAMMFPEAKFIHNIREPHQVVASLSNFEAAGGVSLGIADGIQTWLDHVYACYTAQKALGSNRVLTVRYNQLLSDPRGFLESILNFAGEPWSDDCLTVVENKINSSNVDRERSRVLAMISSNPAYVRAKELYDEVISGTNCAPEAEASREIERLFQEISAQHRLI